MPLIKSTLENGLKKMQKSPPSSLVDASAQWANAFFSYFSPALAAGSTNQPALNVATLTALFLKSMTAGTFMDQLPSDLNTWLATAAWVGPGTGVGVIGAPLVVLPVKQAALNSADYDFAKGLASQVHSWAGTLTVSITNVATGVTTVVPLA